LHRSLGGGDGRFAPLDNNLEFLNLALRYVARCAPL
jgi:hypothetical protein